MKRKIYIVIVISFLAALALAAYIFLRIGQQRTITVGLKWVHQAQFAGMYVAQEHNIYRKHALNVRFKEFSVGTNQIEDLLNGTTNFALVSAEEFLAAVSEGAPITAIGTIYQQSPMAIVSLQTSPITTPSELISNTIGNKGGKLEAKVLYNALLGTVGAGPNDTDIRDLDFATLELEDLQAGTVDAVNIYRTDQLYFFDQQGIKYNLLLPERFGVNMFNDVIITTNVLIQNDPQLISDFLSGTVAGWKDAIADPSGAVRTTLQYVTSRAYKDQQYEQYILEHSIPLIQENPSAPLGYMDIQLWQRLYNNLYSLGVIKQDFDVRNVYSNNFLP